MRVTRLLPTGISGKGRSIGRARLLGVLAVLCCGYASSVSADGWHGSPSDDESSSRPNIVLIVADDLGYSDLGAFGSEINTPNLDALARDGQLMLNHYASPTCSPTRAMLHSGTDHHLVGLGAMAEVLDRVPGLSQVPGYEGYLNSRAVTFAEVLQDNGYDTFMVGKWHLGLTEERSPQSWGYDHSFVLTEGAGNNFAPDASRPTNMDAISTYREDGQSVSVPEDFFSTDFYTDKAIAYLRESATNEQPFLAVVNYTATHWPIQAPDSYIDKYRGKYDEGYDRIRERRIARQKQLGLISQDFAAHEPTPSTAENPRWDDLTAEEKAREARLMEVYAAMVDHMDANIGKLIRYLKRTGQYDNTLIFFQSDNGPAGGQVWFPPLPSEDNSLENIGRRYSSVAYGRRWAEVSAAPFRPWKAQTTEGGMRVPAIMRLPAGYCDDRPSAPFRPTTYATDVSPTFLDVADVPLPGTEYRGRQVAPITGVSMLPALEQRAEYVHPPDHLFALELMGYGAVRQGRWKWVNAPDAYGTAGWELYDMATDPGEAQDVSADHPAVIEGFQEAWDDYVQENNVVLLN